MTPFTKDQTCRMFNCTMEQLNQQYAANADTLEKMYQKAVATGKKVNKYTAAELKESAERYRQLATSS